MKYILTDIEGTTTSINFVHEKLFPYAYDKMESFLTKNQNEELRVSKEKAEVLWVYFFAEVELVILSCFWRVCYALSLACFVSFCLH